jgi:hypothetical protein
MRVLAGVVVAAGLLLTGCVEDVNAIGRTAVSVNADGQPVVVMIVCESSIDYVAIYEGRDGLAETEENATVGEWRATKGLDGVVELDLTEPSPAWQSHDGVTFGAETLYLVETDGDDGTAGGVDFRGSDLAKLTPDEVMIENGVVEKRKAFERSCH